MVTMQPLVVAYVVSRFPEVTQTWMLRELERVASSPGLECELFSLFPAKKRTATVHPSARSWLTRLRRPRATQAALALLWWLRRSPGRLLVALANVIAAYWRRPALLARALVTF